MTPLPAIIIYVHLHKVCSSAAYMCIFGPAYMHTSIFYALAKYAMERYAQCLIPNNEFIRLLCANFHSLESIER